MPEVVCTLRIQQSPADELRWLVVHPDKEKPQLSEKESWGEKWRLATTGKLATTSETIGSEGSDFFNATAFVYALGINS
jgi:hypothetical protein